MKKSASILVLVAAFVLPAVAQAACDATAREGVWLEALPELPYSASRMGFTLDAAKAVEVGASDGLPLVARLREAAVADFGEFVDVRDAVALIRRDQALWERSGFNVETARRARVTAEAARYLREMNCLEALLFESHLEIRGHEPRTTSEFVAFVVAMPNSTQFEVRLFSNNQPAAIFTPLLIEVDALIARGGRIVTLVHNHPFFWGTAADADRSIGGGVNPSSPDLESFAKQARARGANDFRITNGFSTFVVDAPGAVELCGAECR